jgi:hypothetical protein
MRMLARHVVPAAVLAIGCLAVPGAWTAEKASDKKESKAEEKRDGGDHDSMSHKELEAAVAKLLVLVNDLKISQDLLLQELSGLQLACTVPDLLPLPKPGTTDASGFCRLDANGRLQVLVHNQGGGTASPSKTTVDFHTASAPGFLEVTQDTPQIVGFAGTLLTFDFPADCVGVDSNCEFKIFVDDTEVVAESNEGNNRVLGKCTGPIL